MTDNRFGKYLLYAAGEIVLIVFGILIALQIDNWYQARKDKVLELEYMRSLIEDLEGDIAESRRVLDSLNATIDGTNSVVEALASPEIASNSNAAYRLWSANLGFADFVSNDRTLQRLSDDRGFALIRFKQVADSIIEYDQALRLFYLQQEICNEYLLQQGPYQKLFDAIGIMESPDQPVPLSDEGAKVLSQAYIDRKIWIHGLGGLAERLKTVNTAGQKTVKLIREYYGI